MKGQLSKSEGGRGLGVAQSPDPGNQAYELAVRYTGRVSGTCRLPGASVKSAESKLSWYFSLCQAAPGFGHDVGLFQGLHPFPSPICRVYFLSVSGPDPARD